MMSRVFREDKRSSWLKRWWFRSHFSESVPRRRPGLQIHLTTDMKSLRKGYWGP